MKLRDKVRKLLTLRFSEELQPQCFACITQSTDQFYYVNAVTKKTTWTKPTDEGELFVCLDVANIHFDCYICTVVKTRHQNYRRGN